jgi:hypothetical protein
MSVSPIREALTIVAAVVVAFAEPSAQVSVHTFDGDAVGGAPSGFTFAVARQQVSGRWLVRAEGPNHYLTHLGDTAALGGFSLAVLETPHPEQLRASVRLKLTEGERQGGLVWNYRDPENFSLAALDLAVQELAVYRVVRGNRIRLDSEDDLELDSSAWHSLRVDYDEDGIRVSLGGIGVLRARDRTFSGAGRAGVWSGGSATAWFDDLRIEPEGSRRRGR